MISQTLMDKLRQLRLPAFREGLREQTSNPHYAELAFEERLLLLVEMECTRRLDCFASDEIGQMGIQNKLLSQAHTSVV